jgi:hypothetical protein
MSSRKSKISAGAKKTIADLNHVASTKSSEAAGTLPWSADDDKMILSLAEKELQKTG